MAELGVLLWCLAVLALGTAFGGTVGALSWRRGHTVGTGLGLAAVRTVTRALEVRPSRTVTGAAVGACDALLLIGTLLVVALFIDPFRELLAGEEFRRESLRTLGLLALAAVALSVLAWVLLNTSLTHFFEAVLGCGCMVGFTAYMAGQFGWQWPWAYGVAAGVLSLVLVYVVFPGRWRRPPPVPPTDAVTHFKVKPPPDEHIRPRED
jgi:hypothetical protein